MNKEEFGWKLLRMLPNFLLVRIYNSDLYYYVKRRQIRGTYISFTYFGELSEGDFVMLTLGERTHYFKVTKVVADNPHVLEIEAKDTRSLPQGIDIRKLIGLEIQKVTDSQQIQNIQKSLCQI